MVGQVKCRDLVAKAWYALRKYKDIKVRAKNIDMAMRARYNQIVLTKCVEAWKKYAPERQLKNELCTEL